MNDERTDQCPMCGTPFDVELTGNMTAAFECAGCGGKIEVEHREREYSSSSTQSHQTNAQMFSDAASTKPKWDLADDELVTPVDEEQANSLRSMLLVWFLGLPLFAGAWSLGNAVTPEVKGGSFLFLLLCIGGLLYVAQRLIRSRFPSRDVRIVAVFTFILLGASRWHSGHEAGMSDFTFMFLLIALGTFGFFVHADMFHGNGGSGGGHCSTGTSSGRDCGGGCGGGCGGCGD